MDQLEFFKFMQILNVTTQYHGPNAGVQSRYAVANEVRNGLLRSRRFVWDPGGAGRGNEVKAEHLQSGERSQAGCSLRDILLQTSP